MDIVALQPGTDLHRLVALTGSRKRKAILSPARERVTLTGTYWSGGSRSDYWLVDLNTWQARPLSGVAPAQFGGPQEDPVVNLEPHQAVVCAGTFSGRPATPVVTFHPSRQV